MLNSKQKKFIPEYLRTGNIKATCEKLKMDESTFYKWKENEEFSVELKKQQDELYNNSLDDLKILSKEAINTLKELLGDDISSIRLRTACAILDNTFKFVESKELKERIEMLEAALEKENSNNDFKK